ncbi:unnamed protein product [Lepidochelys olivacea]
MLSDPIASTVPGAGIAAKQHHATRGGAANLHHLLLRAPVPPQPHGMSTERAVVGDGFFSGSRGLRGIFPFGLLSSLLLGIKKLDPQLPSSVSDDYPSPV